MAEGAGKRFKGTDTIYFVDYKDSSECQKHITNGRIVVHYRPQKEDPNCIILTVGGNLIEYHRDTRTSTDDTTTANILWNSVVSTPKAKYMCIDINNFYLGTPLTRYEYLCIETT